MMVELDGRDSVFCDGFDIAYEFTSSHWNIGVSCCQKLRFISKSASWQRQRDRILNTALAKMLNTVKI